MRVSGATAAWYLVYNIVLHVGALLCLPFWLFARLVGGRYRGQFAERMGILPAEVVARFGGSGAVWVHAASAGETSSAVPLLRDLRARDPARPMLFTVTSRYGKEMAQRRLGDLVDAICFSPLDLPWFCRRFLRRVKPAVYLMIETDLWPNLVRLARRGGAVVAVASGHAGPRSFPRPFWRAVFRNVDRFWMQSAVDAANLVARGADPARVEPVGNMKFDAATAAAPAEGPEAVAREFGFDPARPLLVAGSVLAEDEGPVLDAIVTLRSGGIHLLALLAPRRQERVAAVLAACAERGLDAVRRTDGRPGALVVLDTMGELARAYRAASVAYVGGGWTPDVGLHNLLEPLVCGVPVLFGPHHGKASRIAAEIVREGAGIEVADGGAFAEALRALIAGPERRAAIVRAGEGLLTRHHGAAARVLARLDALVAERGAA